MRRAIPRPCSSRPVYDDVALDVFDALEARIAACVAAGIARDRLIADPGIGFGKSFRHNLDLLRQFTLFHGLGVPLLMGLSRKGFIGALTGEKLAAQPGQRFGRGAPSGRPLTERTFFACMMSRRRSRRWRWHARAADPDASRALRSRGR